MDVILQERHDRVALITLNRPDVHNAIDPKMACVLADLFADLSDDDSVLAVVITGAGEKAFCAGGDLGRTLPLLSGARVPQDAYEQRVVDDPDILTRAALRMPFDKPVVAAVNGFCLAGGTEMLLGTDIRVAADHASFGLPEVRHGLIPFAGAMSRLPVQIPSCAAMEILLVGAPLSAADAFRLGLVNVVLPADDVLPHALDLATKISRNGPLAVREIKRTVRASLGQAEAAAFALEDAARDRVMASLDAREGPAAFIEKRRPQFTGR